MDSQCLNIQDHWGKSPQKLPKHCFDAKHCYNYCQCCHPWFLDQGQTRQLL
jgi:hypothetical protein